MKTILRPLSKYIDYLFTQKTKEQIRDELFLLVLSRTTSADTNIRAVEIKKVKNLYVEKSKRNSGAGYWYKVRAGKFKTQSDASDFANQLVAAKKVRNYFIISLPKK